MVFDQSPPPVLIEGVTVNGGVLPYHDLKEPPQTANHVHAPVRLPSDLRSMEFQFTALNFSTPEKIRFRHRLDLNLVRHQLDRNPVLRQSRCDRNRDRSRKRDRLRILQLDRSRNRILLRSLVLLRSRGRRRRGRNRVPRLRPNRSLARRANRARNIRNES
ncbi:MAG: hypothetical protein WA891_18965, partial [Acidobacteriaceae bacterium]